MSEAAQPQMSTDSSAGPHGPALESGYDARANLKAHVIVFLVCGAVLVAENLYNQAKFGQAFAAPRILAFWAAIIAFQAAWVFLIGPRRKSASAPPSAASPERMDASRVAAPERPSESAPPAKAPGPAGPMNS
ncbi:MAG: hypothetical protein GMKNLPBB_00270 [Myxococcota bacterium]|nr:hypothetical protein [Myxococcota bacterium]